MRNIMKRKVSCVLAVLMLISISITGCGKAADNASSSAATGSTVTGSTVTGSTVTGSTTASDKTIELNKVEVGIAWRADTDSEFYTNIVTALQEAGATPVLLDQVQSADLTYENGKLKSDCIAENDMLKLEYAKEVKENTYKDSNVKEVVGNLKAVVFTGGEDIAPTLYETPEEWHGIEAEKDYNATRDVSDYLLMSYCIDQNIAVLGLCRGMQMLSVVSGATAIQDIPVYFDGLGKEYNNEHRNVKSGNEYRDYAPHDVELRESTLLFNIMGDTVIHNVPSWHHQAVKSVENTNLKVSGTVTVSGEEMIEAVERSDKTFVIGLQFHPEAAIVKNMNNAANKSDFMGYEASMKVFRALVEHIK